MHAAPHATQALPELDVLRIKVAHLECQVAQLQAQLQLQQLQTSRDALIKKTLLAYVCEPELDHYVIDLEAGTVRPREEVPVWEPTPLP